MRAIELIGEAPEHDGRVVVVIPNHAPQVLFNAVVVRFGGIWTKVINPWNLCLYNQAQCIALFKRIGIVWIMGKAHKVAAQLCNVRVIGMELFLRHRGHRAGIVLVQRYATQRVGTAVE